MGRGGGAPGGERASASVPVVRAEGADAEDVRLAVASRLRDDYKLEHVTIQTERVACEDAALTHL